MKERNITFIEARKIVSAESEGRPAQGGRTATAVVASRSGLTPPAIRSVEVQTDLTWPKGLEQPTTVPSSAGSTSQQTTQTTEKLSPRRKDTGDTHPSGKRQSTQSPSPDALTRKKNSFNKPHGKPPKRGRRSLDLLGLPSLILRSQRGTCSSHWTWTQDMGAHQSHNTAESS